MDDFSRSLRIGPALPKLTLPIVEARETFCEIEIEIDRSIATDRRRAAKVELASLLESLDRPSPQA